MLVPLYTLPGWPSVENPSVLQLLGLLIGFPALAFVVVIAVAKIGNMVKGNRDDGAVTEPLWVGGREIEQGSPGASPSGASQSKAESGGASARW